MERIKSPKLQILDLFDLIKLIWNGKWLLCSCITFFALIGFYFYHFSEKVYHSQIKLNYNFETVPLFYKNKKDRLIGDFENAFYNEKIFQEWHKMNPFSNISYKDFSLNKNFKNIKYLKNKSDVQAYFSKYFFHVSNQKNGPHLIVKSNNSTIINDYYNYLKHIDIFLRKNYIEQTIGYIEKIEKRLENLNPSNETLLHIVENELLIDKLRKGSSSVTVNNPKSPQKISPKLSSLIVLVLIGGIIGILVIFIRFFFNKNFAATKI